MGVDTKERKERERMSCKRKGTRAHDRKGHESLGTRLHPFLEAERVRPAFRALRLGQRARKGDEEATSSSRPSLAALEGAWGLQCPRRVGSGGNGRSPRRKARAVGPSALSSGWLLRPHRRGRQLRQDARPAPDGRAGYLKRGESFRHSSKSTVIFILPPLRLAGGAGRAEGVAGAAALGTQTATAGSRPRLALHRAEEGASPAGHSSREDRGGSNG